MTEPCIDCGDGTCQWAGCEAEADYALRDLVVNRQGATIHVGDVELCGGHKRRAERLGRVELDWDRILRAVS